MLVGQEALNFLAILLLAKAKSSAVFAEVLTNSLIVSSNAFMKKEYAEKLLKQTTENYNLIAKDFSRTRRFIWDDIKPLANFTVPGERVLDIGCGNGRLLQVFRDIDVDYTGVDSSEKLIEEAKMHYPNARFHVYDALRLPLQTNYFDKAYAIAILHHIPSHEMRLRFLREAKRVLRQDGLLILTVWDLWTWKGVGRMLKTFLFKTAGCTHLDFKDVTIPWGKTCDRYIHAFTKGELKKLVKEAGFKVKEVGVLDSGNKKNKNFYVVAEDPTP